MRGHTILVLPALYLVLDNRVKGMYLFCDGFLKELVVSKQTGLVRDGRSVKREVDKDGNVTKVQSYHQSHG